MYSFLSLLKVFHLISFHVGISSALYNTWISMWCVHFQFDSYVVISLCNLVHLRIVVLWCVHSQLDSYVVISLCDLVRVRIVALVCVESGWRMPKNAKQQSAAMEIVETRMMEWGAQTLTWLLSYFSRSAVCMNQYPNIGYRLGSWKKYIAVSLPECVAGTDRLEESRGCTDHMSLSLYQDNRLCHVDS